MKKKNKPLNNSASMSSKACDSHQTMYAPGGGNKDRPVANTIKMRAMYSNGVWGAKYCFIAKAFGCSYTAMLSFSASEVWIELEGVFPFKYDKYMTLYPYPSKETANFLQEFTLISC
jgi:hypothetical protein